MQLTSADIQEFISGLSVRPDHQINKTVGLPQISVIVPSLNQGRFLERTILSILNQNYLNTEIIIIDGGSTDETLSVIDKYKNFITHWVSEPDKGQSHALNKGLAVAKGEIIAWQNSDDIYCPGAFELIGRIFSANPEISVCYGNWISVDEKNRITDIHYALKPRIPHAAFENVDAYNQSMFWRSDCCRQCGGFDENLNSLMDTEFIVRTLKHAGPKSFYRIDAFLGAFRWHETQKTDFTKRTKEQQTEENYIENKFNFPSGSSIFGTFYRLRYRFFQLVESLFYGGLSYTLKKFKQTYRRRGRFI